MFSTPVVLRGEAVLLCSTAKVVHGYPLHVGAGLDIIWIRNQIRKTCEQEEEAESIVELPVLMQPPPQKTTITVKNTTPVGQDCANSGKKCLLIYRIKLVINFKPLFSFKNIHILDKKKV